MSDKRICLNGEIISEKDVPQLPITRIGEPSFLVFPAIPIFKVNGKSFFVEIKTLTQYIVNSIRKYGFQITEDTILKNLILLTKTVPEYSHLYPSAVINKNANGDSYQHFFVTGKAGERHNLGIQDPVGIVTTPLPGELHDYLKNPRKSIDLDPYRNHLYASSDGKHHNCSGVLFVAPNGFLQFFGGALIVLRKGDTLILPHESHCAKPAPWRTFFAKIMERHEYKITSEKIRLSRVLTSDEVFFVDSGLKVSPVEWISGHLLLKPEKSSLMEHLQSILGFLTSMILVQGASGYSPYTKIE